MRVLVLGADGMVGYKLWQVFSTQFDTFGTIRGALSSHPLRQFFDADRIEEGVCVTQWDRVRDAGTRIRPAVVVNCIALLPYRSPISSWNDYLTINAIFPHWLARLCQEWGAWLIHLSTDGVFSGLRGNYSEDDWPDPIDRYGQSKLLGELACPGCLTLRTSLLGPNRGRHGLVDWFLAQAGRSVPGHTRAIFSGMTTGALADILVRLLREHFGLQGIWHLASRPISKFDLLCQLASIYSQKTTVYPDDTVRCDRSLNAERFRRLTGLEVPAWCSMLEAMSADRLNRVATLSV